jgi:hypothetical protein
MAVAPPDSMTTDMMDGVMGCWSKDVAFETEAVASDAFFFWCIF